MKPSSLIPHGVNLIRFNKNWLGPSSCCITSLRYMYPGLDWCKLYLMEHKCLMVHYISLIVHQSVTAWQHIRWFDFKVDHVWLGLEHKQQNTHTEYLRFPKFLVLVDELNWLRVYLVGSSPFHILLLYDSIVITSVGWQFIQSFPYILRYGYQTRPP